MYAYTYSKAFIINIFRFVDSYLFHEQLYMDHVFRICRSCNILVSSFLWGGDLMAANMLQDWPFRWSYGDFRGASHLSGDCRTGAPGQVPRGG